MTIKTEKNTYKIIEDLSNCFNEEEFLLKCTDYFEDFDYIVGDFAYGKLRLKGFNDKSNKNFKKINDYSKVKTYLKENCAYGCKYYILKRENI